MTLERQLLLAWLMLLCSLYRQCAGSCVGTRQKPSTPPFGSARGTVARWIVLSCTLQHRLVCCLCCDFDFLQHLSLTSISVSRSCLDSGHLLYYLTLLTISITVVTDSCRLHHGAQRLSQCVVDSPLLLWPLFWCQAASVSSAALDGSVLGRVRFSRDLRRTVLEIAQCSSCA